MAPYWCDGDTRLEGSVRYEVHQEGQGGSSTLLNSIAAYIDAAASAKLIPSRSSDYQARFAIVADWTNVHPFPHGFGINDETTEPVMTLCL